MPMTDKLQAALSDRYSIERHIGEGGMATVYLARDIKHDREVAVKVLRADLSAVIGTERFLSEIKIAARLDHPHILTLIDSGAADGILYYVLPYVRGESLRVKVEREKQLGVDEALSITKQVASALDYAHGQGVVHRDIKPENILLHEGEAVLADFGIALAVKEAGGNRLTETGLSLGTPQYMSPEQATGDRTLDRRSDIYSLGAVFYEMIAGEPPVTGATAQAVIAKLLTERPVRLSVIRNTISPEMERAVEKSLAKVPADRFKSAGDFVRALEAAAPASRGTSRTTWITRGLIGAAALVILVLAALLAKSKLAGSREPAAVLRDRTLITNTGRVSLPQISPDGKTLAYKTTACTPSGCSYGIELQDVDGSASHRLIDGAGSIYTLKWSPDRRNLLFVGTYRGAYGSFLISALGGTPRFVAAQGATFWSGGDSLVFTRNDRPGDVHWIQLSGLDGTANDSIQIREPGVAIAGIFTVPNSQFFIVGLSQPPFIRYVAVNRAGDVESRMKPRVRIAAQTASSDAFWIMAFSNSSSTGAVVRIPFDAQNGRFGAQEDTIYSGTPTAISVTADGSALAFDEGTTEWSGWALETSEALRGVFPPTRRIFSTTAPIGIALSPDGKRLLLRKSTRSAKANGADLTLMPFEGGGETPFASSVFAEGWADSVSVVLSTITRGGIQLKLVDANTRAERERYLISDTTVRDLTDIPGGGWAWIPSSSRAVMVHGNGTHDRTFAMPPWYHQLFSVNASPDGKSLVLMGWRAPDEDSLGVSIISLENGAETHIKTMFVETASSRWLPDGSILIRGWDTQESVSIYRLTTSGDIQKLGSIPRPVVSLQLSDDLKRAAIVVRDYHGDAWIGRIVRR